MPVQSVNLPEGLKKEIERRLERDDYQNTSEFIRDAIREKLKRETELRSEEIKRIMQVRERDRDGEQKWIPLEEVREELGLEG